MNRAASLATCVVVLPLLWVGIFCCESTATIINVPADYPTIQEAVDSSSTGDTVLVQPNTYYEWITFNGHNIVLGSLFLTTGDTSYVDSTILDGQSVWTCVEFENGEDTTAVITGFTITNGRAQLERGGGILCHNSSPKITSNRIVGNTSEYTGGGVACVGSSSPIIRGNLIEGNSSFPSTGGGGVTCESNSNPVISDNVIAGNFAGSLGGGGIYCYNSDPYISDNTISGNRSDGSGGGIVCLAGAGPTIVHNTISENRGSDGGGIGCYTGAHPTISSNTIAGDTAWNQGGGVDFVDADPAIIGNTIEGNHAIMGAAIRCDGLTNAEILNNVISGNTASGAGGGGIYCTDSNPAIVGNLIIRNWGEGILCSQSDPTVRNNTISGNGVGGVACYSSSPIFLNSIIEGTYAGSGFHLAGGSPSITYCDFYNNQNGDFSGDTIIGIGVLDTVNYNGDSCDVYFNIFTDPMFVDTASGDYHLTAGSPCIDAGDPNSPRDPDTTFSDIGCYFFDQGMPDILLSATVLDFGTVTVGDSADLELVIYNLGNGVLLLSSISNGLAVFRADWNPLDTLIPPFDSLEINIGFTPDDTVAFEDTLWIDNNDTLSYVQLLGTGAAAPGITDGHSLGDAPRAFALELKGSNPCNSSTVIQFALPRATGVDLEVYDVTGRKITTLVHGWLAAGVHKAFLDLSEIPSGVYLCHLDTREFKDTRKVMVIR